MVRELRHGSAENTIQLIASERAQVADDGTLTADINTPSVAVPKWNRALLFFDGAAVQVGAWDSAHILCAPPSCLGQK